MGKINVLAISMETKQHVVYYPSFAMDLGVKYLCVKVSDSRNSHCKYTGIEGKKSYSCSIFLLFHRVGNDV